jgi:hypothetical protein
VANSVKSVARHRITAGIDHKTVLEQRVPQQYKVWGIVMHIDGKSTKEYLTPKQTASRFNMGRSTLARDRMLGIGCPYIKLWNKILYIAEDVESFLQANRVVPTPTIAS